ncbi:hypothetical protein [Sphingomonas ginsengisoli (ex An et al. 2013)]|uniref:hypothetical protein n=3 Tax=Sphingomonas TaxID=13687 RepID=UPI00126A558A|nr:hypothetical protein [Sphingomonas ginsengisoli An et al. 2013]
MTTGLLTASALALPATALAKSQTYVDVTAGLGYSTNPLLALGDNTGSGFGRFSLYGYHGWTTERTSSSISAFVENSSYFKNYGNKQVFSLAANTSYAANEKVKLFGSLGFSGDIGGQLGSRFYGVPAGSVTPDPTIPTTIVIVDPNLYGLNQRQYTLSANGGASIGLSAKDAMDITVGAQHLFVSGNNVLDYTSYDTTIGYNRQVRERLTVGGRLLVQYADYKFGRSIFEIGPQATISARLSEQWDLSAAIGFVRTTQDFGIAGVDNSSSVNLALDASLCRQLEYERICARAARRTQSSVVGAAPVSTTASLDYYRKLGAKDSIQGTASVSRTGAYRIANQGGSSTFYTVSAAYDRLINDRISAGVNAAWRKLTLTGPDPKTDIGGSVYLRYRLGDLR